MSESTLKIHYMDDWRPADRFTAFGEEWYAVKTPAHAIVAIRVADLSTSKIGYVPAAEPVTVGSDTFTPRGAPHAIAFGTLTTDGQGTFWRWHSENHVERWHFDHWQDGCATWMNHVGRKERPATAADIAPTTIPLADVPESLRAAVDRLRTAKPDPSRVVTPSGRTIELWSYGLDTHGTGCWFNIGDIAHYVGKDALDFGPNGKACTKERGYVPNRWPLPDGTAARIDAYLDALAPAAAKGEQFKSPEHLEAQGSAEHEAIARKAASEPWYAKVTSENALRVRVDDCWWPVNRVEPGFCVHYQGRHGGCFTLVPVTGAPIQLIDGTILHP